MITKEEQPTRYYYKVVKDCSVIIPREMHDSRKEKTYTYKVGELAEVIGENKTKKLYENENFQFSFKFRPAFIGDMQAKLDEAYGFSNFEHYLKTTSNQVEPVRYITNIVYKRINIFQWLYMKAKELIINYKVNRWVKNNPYYKKQKDEVLDSEFLDMIYNNEKYHERQ